MNELKFLGIKDLADLFSCSEKEAYKLMRRPDFPSLRVGGKWKVSSKALEEWASVKRD